MARLRTDARGRVPFLNRVAVALQQQQPVLLPVHVLRAVRAQPDHRGAVETSAGDVPMPLGRQVEAVAGELDAIHREPPLGAGVPRERDRVAVLERARLAPDLNDDRRVARGFHAEHADGLQVGSGVARRRDAPGAQVVADVAGREPEPGAEHRPALEIVGGDIGEPLLEVPGRD